MLHLAQGIETGQVSPLCLIGHRVGAVKALGTQQAQAAGRQVAHYAVADGLQVATPYKVAQPHPAAKLEQRQRHIEVAGRVGRVVKGHGTLRAPPAPDVLGEHIALALVLNDVGLQPERVLVEGYQLFVLYE